MITKVTITGADDSINPERLLELSVKYPFVEWGILVSGKRYGTNRFPSVQWLDNLFWVWVRNDIRLSCHLCGAYVRELAGGSRGPIDKIGTIWDMFQRVQLNFHAIPHHFDQELFAIIKSYPEKEFIFQRDSVNDNVARYAKDYGVGNCSTLYDTSHGAGVSPKEVWPDPLPWIPCGYAGGISPDNIRSQILIIDSITGLTKTWIDMETHVRSDDDALFDLEKVNECLKISEEYIKPF